MPGKEFLFASFLYHFGVTPTWSKSRHLLIWVLEGGRPGVEEHFFWNGPVEKKRDFK